MCTLSSVRMLWPRDLPQIVSLSSVAPPGCCARRGRAEPVSRHRQGRAYRGPRRLNLAWSARRMRSLVVISQSQVATPMEHETPSGNTSSGRSASWRMPVASVSKGEAAFKNQAPTEWESPVHRPLLRSCDTASIIQAKGELVTFLSADGRDGTPGADGVEVAKHVTVSAPRALLGVGDPVLGAERADQRVLGADSPEASSGTGGARSGCPVPRRRSQSGTVRTGCAR